MELPAFILGLSTLVLRWRSNVLFAVTFGATRIAFRLVLLYGLAMCASSSYFPWQLTDLVAGTAHPRDYPCPCLPLHAMWFRGCIAGFVRRHKARVAARSSSGESVVVQKTLTEIGIDGSDKSGSPPRTSSSAGKPVSAIVQSRLDRLPVLSSTLLEGGRNGGGARWPSGPAGWVSPGVTMWLERGRGGGSRCGRRSMEERRRVDGGWVRSCCVELRWRAALEERTDARGGDARAPRRSQLSFPLLPYSFYFIPHLKAIASSLPPSLLPSLPPAARMGPPKHHPHAPPRRPPTTAEAAIKTEGSDDGAADEREFDCGDAEGGWWDGDAGRQRVAAAASAGAEDDAPGCAGRGVRSGCRCGWGQGADDAAAKGGKWVEVRVATLRVRADTVRIDGPRMRSASVVSRQAVDLSVESTLLRTVVVPPVGGDATWSAGEHGAWTIVPCAAGGGVVSRARLLSRHQVAFIRRGMSRSAVGRTAAGVDPVAGRAAPPTAVGGGVRRNACRMLRTERGKHVVDDGLPRLGYHTKGPCVDGGCRVEVHTAVVSTSAGHRVGVHSPGASSAVLSLRVPGREVREKVMGYVRGTLAPTPPSTPQVEVPSPIPLVLGKFGSVRFRVFFSEPRT
ncbi:hypothetical protein C8R45DRAFT_1124195 [Mycena sanguinolenta]|nr:hypothetical protein C8R45DRAFT_1124195 [Mycena sanguinolenta]